MLQARDVEEEGRMQSMTLRERGRRSAAAGGSESGVVDSVRDDGDARQWNAEEASNVVCGIAADRDDVILSVRELSDDRAAVEHPQHVVLFRQPERCEVVNRGNECT